MMVMVMVMVIVMEGRGPSRLLLLRSSKTKEVRWVKVEGMVP